MHDSPNLQVLELRNLCGGWGPTIVVEGVSLSLRAGETIAILGRNSVGKSTLMELLMGRAQLRSGEVMAGSVPLHGVPSHHRVHNGIAYVPQAREVFRDLTVSEHFDIASRPGEWTRERVFDLFPSLKKRIKTLAGQLSGGEQQMLSIGRALVCNPRILLMDEPSEGLAPVVVDQLVDAMRAVIEDQHLAILLIEQRVDIALEFADRCLVMDRGRIVFEGDGENLRENAGQLERAIGLDYIEVPLI